MTDFAKDREDAKRIEQEVRRELGEVMKGAARISEFTVDLPGHLHARQPLPEAQYEVAIALNTLVRLLDDRAEEACKAKEPRWGAFPMLALWLPTQRGIAAFRSSGTTDPSPITI